jgi:hypothetical protein
MPPAELKHNGTRLCVPHANESVVSTRDKMRESIIVCGAPHCRSVAEPRLRSLALFQLNMRHLFHVGWARGIGVRAKKCREVVQSCARRRARCMMHNELKAWLLHTGTIEDERHRTECRGNSSMPLSRSLKTRHSTSECTLCACSLITYTQTSATVFHTRSVRAVSAVTSSLLPS